MSFSQDKTASSIFKAPVWSLRMQVETKRSCNIAKDFSAYFSNLAEHLVSKVPNPSNKFGVLSVGQYYSHLVLTKKFHLLPTQKDYIIKILGDIDTSKAAGIDKLPGRFLKDGANALAKPVTDICNLSTSLNKFPRAFKLAEAERIFKKG